MNSPFFLFAHGAGAGSSHPWMQHWATLLKTLGRVQTFDYPYIERRERRPDPMPKLLAAHRVALANARHNGGGGSSIVLIGKSMGSRIGCHLALEESVPAIVCLGYPLCAGGNREKMRDTVLRQLARPILFVQGTRDPLCPLDLLEEVRGEMRAPNAPNELVVVEGGDHSLQVTKSQLKARNETQDDVDRRILEAIGHFLSVHLPRLD